MKLPSLRARRGLASAPARSGSALPTRIHLRTHLSSFVLSAWFVLVAAATSLGVEGFTEPYRVVRVAAPEAGTVAEILVRQGAGEPIARLDSEVHKALVAIAQADRASRGRLAAARAELRLRESRLEALERLRAGGHAREEEIHRATADRDIAAAQLRAALESVHLKDLEYEKIRAQVERRTVRSPIDGYVIDLFKEPGEFVSAGDPYVMTVVQLDPIAATFDVPQKTAASLHRGDNVHIEVIDGPIIQDAKVEFISPIIDAESGTIRVRVVIPNADGAHRSGERCKLRSH